MAQIISKKVVKFLAETRSSEAKISHEHASYGWLTFDETMGRVGYQTTKHLLKHSRNIEMNTVMEVFLN